MAVTEKEKNFCYVHRLFYDKYCLMCKGDIGMKPNNKKEKQDDQSNKRSGS